MNFDQGLVGSVGSRRRCVELGRWDVAEELDYSPGDAETAIWLRVFKDIFVKSEHQGHYTMKLRNPD